MGQAVPDIGPANVYYTERRAELDQGAVASWEARKAADELSAVQHAMNLWCERGKEAFFAEFQNAPIEEEATCNRLAAAAIAEKVNGLARGAVPKSAQHVTAFIDVHERLLYWIVCAWGQDFGGAVIDYGTHPRQPVSYFAQQSASVAMANVHPGMAEDAWLVAGLTETTAALLSRQFTREDGALLRIGKLLIDAHWGQKTELVKTFCRRHPQSWSIVCPSIGHFIGASSRPYSDYRPEPGAQTGHHWRAPPARGGDRHVLVDVNWWKTFAAERLALPIGTPGAWTLFGREVRAEDHRLFADHCVSEAPVETIAKVSGHTVQEWKWLPGRPDNHWWDCLVGAAVAASMLGVIVPGTETRSTRRPPHERPSAADLAARARA